MLSILSDRSLIISLFPFSLVAIKGDVAYDQPLVFWALAAFVGEVAITFFVGLILAIFRPSYLLTEQHQKDMQELQIGVKGRHATEVSQDPQESAGTERDAGEGREG